AAGVEGDGAALDQIDWLINRPRRRNPPAGAARNPEAFVRAMLDLATGKARGELENRLAEFVPRSFTVEQRYDQTGGPANLLDAAAVRDHTVDTMYKLGGKVAADRLARVRFNLPPAARVEAELKRLVTTVEAVFPGVPPSQLKLRANVFLPQGDRLMLLYRWNMDNTPDHAQKDTPENEIDNDADLVLPYAHGLTGRCFVDRMPMVCNLDAFGLWMRDHPGGDADKPFGFDPATQSKIRRDRTWLMSVPIFDPEAGTTRRMKIPLPLHPLAGVCYATLDEAGDGPVFGVLNLDAGWNYATVKMPEDVESQRSHALVHAISDIMRSKARTLGLVFSDCFAKSLP
ncbi:MAG: hypothetical protein KGM43_11970, partial [Planctomycetota bacterium]|nr:hypothetical protein [Planctomycetota bacterium]